MSEDRDPDFDAISERDIFAEAKDRLGISLAAESHNNRLAKSDLLFREGEQWDDDTVMTSASQDEVELTINFTDTLVGRVVNNMAEREPRGKCHPVGDGADTERADVINGIGRHIEYRSEASVAYDGGADSAVTIGWGWWELLSEFETPKSFNKEIRISPIMNSFSVHADPAAIMPTACDMRWCLMTVDMSRTEYKRQYPKAKNASWSDVGIGDDAGDWEEKERVRLAKYFRIREKSEKLCRIKRQSGEEYTRFKSELPILPEGDTIVEERESSRQQVEMFRLNGTKVVEREILPGSFIPIIRCQGNARNIDGKIYRRGMVRSLQDPQRMVNYGEVAKIKRLGLAPKAPWVVAEGQVDGHPEWDNANTQSYSVLTYKPVTVMTAQGEQVLPPPQRQPPAQIEAGFSEFVQGMRSNLLAIAGMPNEPGQDQEQGQVVSGKALNRRDKLSDQSHSQYYKNQKLAIAHTWRIMLEWIPHYYSEERMQRIIGDDGKPQMVKLNEKMAGQGVNSVKNDISVGRYDVVMDSGPSYETKREEGSESLLELASSPTLGPIVAKTAPDLVFRGMDFPYAEEIADRLAAQTPEGLKQIMESLPKEARAVVQSLAGENAQLKQALQEAQLENKYKLAATHMQTTVKAHDVEESNKTKRADTESRERTQIETTKMKIHGELLREEIGVTGKILDTHAKAGHEERAQERMIEAGEQAENGAGK